jgi:CRP-like cAMP-binding protein
MEMIDIDTLLAWGGAYKKVAAEEPVFQEGSECHFYYQLVSGSVRWVNITDEGKEFIQTIIEPGECFGELPLFDDEPYAASAIANKESVVIRLNKSTFKQLLKEQPDLHFQFTKMLTQRLRYKFILVQELGSANPEHTIITLLNYFKKTKRHICPNCNQVNLTRQQIANMTGLRVETIIRAIKQLEEKGTLKIDKGKVFF